MRKQSSTIRDLISTSVVYINPQDTLREAVDTMVENHVSALPVVDARGHCVGVISVTDLLGVTKDLSDELNALSVSRGLDHEMLVEKLEMADVLTEQVSAWMSADVVSVEPDSTIQHAAREMLRNRVHRLIVLDDQKRVVGVISTTDLLAAFAEEKVPA